MQRCPSDVCMLCPCVQLCNFFRPLAGPGSCRAWQTATSSLKTRCWTAARGRSSRWVLAPSMACQLTLWGGGSVRSLASHTGDGPATAHVRQLLPVLPRWLPTFPGPQLAPPAAAPASPAALCVDLTGSASLCLPNSWLIDRSATLVIASTKSTRARRAAAWARPPTWHQK